MIDPTVAMVIEYSKIINAVFTGVLTNGLHTYNGSPRLGRRDNPPLNVLALAISAPELIMQDEIVLNTQ